MKREIHYQEVKFASKVIVISEGISNYLRKQKKQLTKMVGSIQETLVLSFLMVHLKLLIERKIFSNLPKENTSHQRNLKIAMVK